MNFYLTIILDVWVNNYKEIVFIKIMHESGNDILKGKLIVFTFLKEKYKCYQCLDLKYIFPHFYV